MANCSPFSPILFLILMPTLVFSGCVVDDVQTVVVGVPEPGFRLHYDHDEVKIHVEHVGSGLFPNNRGQPFDAHFIRSMADTPKGKYIEILVVSDDFRWAHSKSVVCVDPQEDDWCFAPVLDGPSETWTWFSQPSPWLYGMSFFWGQTLTVDGQEVAIPDHERSRLPNHASYEVEYQNGLFTTRYEDYQAGIFLTDIEASVAWAPEDPVPKELGAYGRKLPLARSIEKASIVSWNSGFETKTPETVQVGKLIPVELDPSYIPFPFTEAFENSKPRIQEDGYVVTWGTTLLRNEYQEDILPMDISEQYIWRFTVLYENFTDEDVVVARNRWLGAEETTTYEEDSRFGGSRDFLEPPYRLVPMDVFYEWAKGLVAVEPVYLKFAVRFWGSIEVGVGTSLRSDAFDGLVMDAHSGNITLISDTHENLEIMGFPDVTPLRGTDSRT